MITIKTAYKHAALRALSGGSGTEVKTASGAIATFNDAIAAPLQSLTYSFLPSQSGSGDPSPDNVRPINGYDSIDIINKDDLTTPTQTQTKTVSFTETVYGGEGDEEGNFNSTYKLETITGSMVTTVGENGGHKYARVVMSELSTGRNADCLCERYKPQTAAADKVITWVSASQKVVWIYDDTFTDLATAQASLNSNPVKYCYPLATPTPLSVTSISMNSFAGDNNIYCDIPNSSVAVEYLSGAPKTKKDKLIPYLPLIYGRKELL